MAAGLLQSLPLTFIPIFVAIDIFAVLPVFLSLTHGLSDEARNETIRESVVTALFVSLAFVVVGEGIFKILGVTDNDFKIAGGLVLLVLAVLDLVRRGEGTRVTDGRMGVVPIGVPLIIGPAVLTTLLVLVQRHGIGVTVASLLLNLLIVWFTFKRAGLITRVLGAGGILAVSKIMALLLASIAVMMVRIGLVNIISGSALPK